MFSSQYSKLGSMCFILQTSYRFNQSWYTCHIKSWASFSSIELKDQNCSASSKLVNFNINFEGDIIHDSLLWYEFKVPNCECRLPSNQVFQVHSLLSNLEELFCLNLVELKVETFETLKRQWRNSNTHGWEVCSV